MELGRKFRESLLRETIPISIKRSPNTLVLRDEKGRALFFDTVRTRPVLIEDGWEFVDHFCREADQIGRSDLLLSKYPDERALLALLLRHSILLNGERKHGTEKISDLHNPEQPDGMTLYLLLSQSCNMECIYCLNGRRTYEKANNLKMSEEVAFRAIELCLKKICPGGTLSISFFGGEPFLNWALAKKCIEKCEREFRRQYKDKKYRFGITTNLSTLPSDFVSYAKDYEIGVLVDIDGPERLHNRLRPLAGGRPSYRAITNNLEKIVKAGIDLSLRTTVTDHNVDSMVEIMRHHRQLGCDDMGFVPVVPLDSDEVVLPEAYYPDPEKYLAGLLAIHEEYKGAVFPLNEYRKRIRYQRANCIACGAPYGNTPAVTANGDVYPCIYLVGNPQYRMCNVIQDDSIQNKPLAESMIRKFDVDETPRCKKCEWRYLCGGGCPIDRMIDNHVAPGSMAMQYAKDIVCVPFIGMAERILWEKADNSVSALNAAENEAQLDRETSINAYC